ncbi:hypothetical protein Leryth_017171 [Lithospermum erythrorhizon]|nr:hypothetical protein Leryth_017171 [Lithospermum erythrorhizon]
MDFSAIGFEGNGLAFSPFSSSNDVVETNKHKWYGSNNVKHEERMEKCEDDWKDLKVAKTSECFFKEMRCNNGYGSEGLNSAIMHGMLSGMKGPFSPSQWMELEHQALIYKYITSNIPIPLPLLIPIQKSLDTACFSNYPGLKYNTLGWSGFACNTDPEPGRCRRTDGKKWRCARDAVANHKYCERHLNRGRHRSRKPVEAGGQSGHSVSGNASGTSKLPLASTTSAAAPKNSASNSSSFMNQEVGNLQPCGTNPATASQHEYDRSPEDKANVSLRAQDTKNVSRLPPTTSFKDHYSPTQYHNAIEGTSRAEFGLICPDSVLNPLNKNASNIYRNNGAFEAGNTGDNNKSQHSLHLFRDDWSKNRSGSSISDRTELSISIPKTPSDYISTTSSPSNETFGVLPLRLLPELGATHMGLGIGAVDEHIPCSWKTPVGGPLGEALHVTTNSSNDNGKRTSALNLMTEL